jgi:hypothetical protein
MRARPSGQIMPPGEHPCNRKIGAMNSVSRGCALLLMAFISWTEPALARNYLNCLMKKVVIVDALTGAVWPTPDEVERYLNAIGSEAATLYREILAAPPIICSIFEPDVSKGPGWGCLSQRIEWSTAIPYRHRRNKISGFETGCVESDRRGRRLVVGVTSSSKINAPFARFCQFCSDARSSLARARKCAASFHACVSYVFNGNFGAPQNDIPGQARDKNPRPSRHSPLTKYN